MRKKLILLLALLVLTAGLGGRVWAAEPPDPSITFVMEFDGTPLEGGCLTLYRVGQIAPDGSSFLLVDALGQVGPSLEDLQASGLAKELYDLAVAYGLQAISAPIEGGRAVASGLETGLYVVGQRTGEETPGYAPIDRFLISLPQLRNGDYVYDPVAAPKVPLVPAPTEPTEPPTPTEPDDPKLPQTGQLNWPVPLMTVLGLTLFVLGWFLFFGHKRRHV